MKRPKVSNGGAKVISRTRKVPGTGRPTKGEKMAKYVNRRLAMKALLEDGARKRAANEKADKGKP